uniref:C-type lectin domain-containing protein n=1 Tax=Amphiprion percula TaxID=161767 RepID=A0A3P8RTT8_AMPPE
MRKKIVILIFLLSIHLNGTKLYIFEDSISANHWGEKHSLRSWEDAVEHCRESYTDLTSLLSETEIQLAQNHIRRYKITEPVWISLRYLGDLWLWVNGDPLVYTAWSPNRDTRCPVLNPCGALTEEGHWEERDCLEKLKFICI